MEKVNRKDVGTSKLEPRKAFTIIFVCICAACMLLMGCVYGAQKMAVDYNVIGVEIADSSGRIYQAEVNSLIKGSIQKGGISFKTLEGEPVAIHGDFTILNSIKSN